MELTLKFFATFREAVGSKTVDREAPDGATVGEILAGLEEEYDGLAGDLLADGDLRPQINVLLNGREVLHMDGIDTVVSDGDTLAVFPPVAGGEGTDGSAAAEDDVDAADGADGTDDTDTTDDTDGDAADADGETRRVEAYRGISRRLAVHYLRNLGGDADGPDEEVTEVEGDGWRAELSAEKASGIGSIELTEVTVAFEGDPATLDTLVERFGQKAMRAGG